MPYPRFSIIIPVKPGGEVKALGSLQILNFPAECFEVLVVEGNSPSRQRNSGVHEATGEVIYFLDDDSLVVSDHLLIAAKHYEDSSVAVVGGPSLTPETDSILQRAFGQAFASLIGGGGVRHRYRKAGTVRDCRESELILCNLSFRKSVLVAYGGFDERLYPNEENELMDRLVRDGHRLIHDPELAVTRSQRPSWRAFSRQLFGYGRGRGEQTRLAGVHSFMPFVPLLLLLYLLTLPFLPGTIRLVPLLCYGAAIGATMIAGSIQLRDMKGGFLLMLALPLMHCFYGLGLVSGLVAPRFTKKSAGVVSSIRRIKEFHPAR